MGFKEQIRPGSFKGASFVATAHTADFGRRVADNEYPFRDTPFTTDLGRKQRQFSISCFVVGNDYFAARDRLREACESSGTGTLIHPWLGNIIVQGKGCTITETAKDGGMASFTLKFSEPGGILFPIRTDTKSTLLNRLEDFLSDAQDLFDSKIDTLPNVTFLRNAVIGNLILFANGMQRSLTRFVVSAVGAKELDDFKQTIDVLISEIKPFDVALSEDARDFVDTIVELSTAAIISDREKIIYLNDLKDDIILDVPGGDPTVPIAIANQVNQIALQDYSQIKITVDLMALISNTNDISSDITSSTFESEAEIDRIQTLVSDFLEVLSFRDSLSELFQQIDGTRKEFILNTNTIKANFDVELFTPLSQVTALYLTNRVLQDSLGYEEFTIRNRVFNPMFLRAGDPLEFLNL